MRALDHLGLVVDDIALRRPTLDEVFMTLTGEPIESTDVGDLAATTGDKARGKKPVPVA